MALPPLPPGAKLDAQSIRMGGELPPLPEGAQLDAQDEAPAAEPGTPLAEALKTQTGEPVTVSTPTGPAQFTRQGQSFFSPEKSAQMMDAGGARLKQRGLEGLLSVLSGGGTLLDEGTGLMKSMSADTLGKYAADRLAGTPAQIAAPSPGQAYESARASARRDVSSATRNASPVVTVAGARIPVLPAIGAAIPSMLSPLPGGAFARMFASGIQGSESAFGASEADLTKGDYSGALRDTGIGGGVGLLSAGAAEAGTAPLRWIAGRAGQEASAAQDVVTQAIQAAKDKAVASARGSLGRVTATQGNSMETVMEVLRNPQWFTDDVVNQAYAIAQSPEGKLMLSRAASNNLTKLSEGFAAEVPAREALSSATSAAQPSAVAGEVAAKIAPGAIAADVGGKFMRSVGQRAALGAAGSGLGAGAAWMAGEDPKVGAGIGATAGFMPQGVLQFARNQSKSPVVQYGANSLIQKLLNQGAGAVGKASRAVGPATDQDDQDAIQAFLSGG